MNHMAAACAAALAVVTASAAGESYAYADEPCTKAHVAVDERGHKVVVSFDNRCDARIGCEVSWSLRCGKGGAEEKSEVLRMDAHTGGEVIASALSCGDDDWHISPPRWRCDEPEDPVNGSKPPLRRRRH
jgi:hypothetical protein